MNCAFQWAQHPNFIYLNVKFSGRIDGPVTVLNVDNENVTLTNESFHFSALGRQKPKTFQLHLQLDRAIVPENSTWAFASVGRISFTLAKAEAGAWPRLLSKNATKPKNMHTWYERQQSLDAQVKREKKERESARRRSASEKEKKDKAAEAPRRRRRRRRLLRRPTASTPTGATRRRRRPSIARRAAVADAAERSRRRRARRRGQPQRRMRSRIGEIRAKFVDESSGTRTSPSRGEAHAVGWSAVLLAHTPPSHIRFATAGRPPHLAPQRPLSFEAAPFAVDVAFAFDCPPRARAGRCLRWRTRADLLHDLRGDGEQLLQQRFERVLQVLEHARRGDREEASSGRAFGFGMGTLAAGARFGEGRAPAVDRARRAGGRRRLGAVEEDVGEERRDVERRRGRRRRLHSASETGTTPSFFALLAFLACRRTGMAHERFGRRWRRRARDHHRARLEHARRHDRRRRRRQARAAADHEAHERDQHEQHELPLTAGAGWIRGTSSSRSAAAARASLVHEHLLRVLAHRDRRRSRTERWMTAAGRARASRRTARRSRRAAACTFTAALWRCSRIASWLKNSNMLAIVDSCRGGADGETVRWRALRCRGR